MSDQATQWRALTLWQPWASAIMDGPKRVENRSWRLSKLDALPRWIALHAGARWDAKGAEFCAEHWADTPAKPDTIFGAIIGIIQALDALIPSVAS